jgi:catechol 2,3-dioxygenase-like lactoylglutathione lyase family enzyme
MAPSLHHAGLLVADLERAGDFYVEALGAEWRVKPMRLGPPDAGAIFGGSPETAADVAIVAVGESLLELFHFVGDSPPPWLRPNGGYVPHIAFRVEDTDTTMERALAAGATRLWDEPNAWGSARTMYLADPDGNAFELIDASAQTLVDSCLAMFPTSRP